MLVNNVLVVSAYFPTRLLLQKKTTQEVNLSAMSGYLAPSNIAETQFR